MLYYCLGIHGNVVDPSGLPVIAAMVSREGYGGSIELNRDGAFHQILPVGKYMITVQAPGISLSQVENQVSI